MNKQKNNLNHPLNKKVNKFKENAKDNKSIGSTAYSKNKKALDQMLREYQSFCKKYFGESTPIGSMTEERMNKLLEDQENNLNQNQKTKNIDNEQFFGIFKGDDEINESEEFLLENFNILDDLPDDLAYCDNNRLGNHKNTKNDYERRNKILFKEKEEIKEKEIKKEEIKEIKNKEEKNNKNDEEYDDFEKEENLEDFKNKKVEIIQRVYRNEKIKNKEKIYFGYDKSKKNILWIFSDKIDFNKNINSIIIKCFNINQKNGFNIKKTIKELLNLDSIPKEKIQENMKDIIDKLDNFQKNEVNNKNKLEKKDNVNNEINQNKLNEEKVVDEDGEEYTF